MQTSRERQQNQFKKTSRRQKRLNKNRKRNNSDAARLFRFVMQQLSQYLPDIMVEHRLTLAMMMTGLLRGRDGRLAKMAEKVVYPHKKPSLVSRFERFVKSSWVEVDPYYLPFAQEILQTVAGVEPIVLMIDSTKLGGNCICLMVSVYYKKRALPLAWHCFKGKKGHSDQATQIELLQRVQAMLPNDTSVVLVGDGEFDGADLLTWLKTDTVWQFVCRTTATTLVYYQDKWLSLTEVVAELGLAAGETAFLSQVTFIRRQPVDQLNIFIAWHPEDQRHLFLVTNCATAAEASHWYDKRFTIETCFGDFKSRGLFLDRTRIRHPDRLERLILAAAGAYYLIILLGVELIFSGIFRQLVRTDAFYHSLSQLGFIFLDHILNEGGSFPELETLPKPDLVNHVVLSP
jgi:hypothetical protein